MCFFWGNIFKLLYFIKLNKKLKLIKIKKKKDWKLFYFLFYVQKKLYAIKIKLRMKKNVKKKFISEQN